MYWIYRWRALVSDSGRLPHTKVILAVRLWVFVHAEVPCTVSGRLAIGGSVAPWITLVQSFWVTCALIFGHQKGGKGDSPVRLRVQTRSECDLLCLFNAWTRIMSRVYHPWERRCVWSDPLVGRWARHLVRRRRLGTSRGVSQWWGRGLRLQREAFGSQGVSQCHRRGTEGWCDLFVGGLIYLLL